MEKIQVCESCKMVVIPITKNDNQQVFIGRCVCSKMLTGDYAQGGVVPQEYSLEDLIYRPSPIIN